MSTQYTMPETSETRDVIFGIENIDIFQVSEIENDVVSVNTKKLDECQQYDITIVPRCIKL